MNYLHAFHAGNPADLYKHCVFHAMLVDLRAKGTSIRLIDTHAGSGLYDLSSLEALKTGEAKRGIGKLLETEPIPLAFVPFVEYVRAKNSGGACRYYPGSPIIAVDFLHHGDYVGFDLRADEAHRLVASVAGKKADIRCDDGFEGAVSVMSTAGEKAHFLLIDPPFEDFNDYAKSAELIGNAIARDQKLWVLMWLPLKDLHTLDQFKRHLRHAKVSGHLFEVRLNGLENPLSLNGSALFVRGPDDKGLAQIGEISNAMVAVFGDAKAKTINSFI